MKGGYPEALSMLVRTAKTRIRCRRECGLALNFTCSMTGILYLNMFLKVLHEAHVWVSVGSLLLGSYLCVFLGSKKRKAL